VNVKVDLISFEVTLGRRQDKTSRQDGENQTVLKATKG
jgi:hypothetical protein